MRLLNYLKYLCVNVFFIIFITDNSCVGLSERSDMNKIQPLETKYIDTRAGKIAYIESTGISIPIVLIHGNSASKEFMQKQVDGLGKEYKVIALDLPGHGESNNASNPITDYTLTGYARTVAEIIQKLELGPVVLVGWSLGGHIAMEFMGEYPELLRGVMVISAPPVSPTEEGFKEAYLPTYSSSLGSKIDPFTPEEVKEYMTQGGVDFDANPELMNAALRAHGLARHTMVNHVMESKVKDERKIVEESTVPLGFILGKGEHAINNDYIKSLNYANCLMLRIIDGGHDLQWSHAKDVNKLIHEFVEMLPLSNQRI